MTSVQPRIKTGCAAPRFLYLHVEQLRRHANRRPGARLVVIEKIEPRETDGKTGHLRRRTHPAIYLVPAHRTLRLVVDIPDTDVRNFKDPLNVDKGPVGTVTPSQMDNIARLEIGLTQPAEARVYQFNGQLIVEITRSVDTAKAETEAVAAVPRCSSAGTRGRQKKARQPL
jgi:hypothetical protein